MTSSGQQNIDYAVQTLCHSVPPAKSCRRGEEEKKKISTHYLTTCALTHCTTCGFVEGGSFIYLLQISLALASFSTASIPSRQQEIFFRARRLVTFSRINLSKKSQTNSKRFKILALKTFPFILCQKSICLTSPSLSHSYCLDTEITDFSIHMMTQ